MVKLICDHCKNEYEWTLWGFFQVGDQLYRVSLAVSENTDPLSWKRLDLCLACRLQIVRNGGWVKG